MERNTSQRCRIWSKWTKNFRLRLKNWRKMFRKRTRDMLPPRERENYRVKGKLSAAHPNTMNLKMCMLQANSLHEARVICLSADRVVKKNMLETDRTLPPMLSFTWQKTWRIFIKSSKLVKWMSSISCAAWFLISVAYLGALKSSYTTWNPHQQKR